MILFPAIDLFEGKAVRLYQGDYARMTVYDADPVRVAKGFREKGAAWVHLVDLEGAKSGTTPNFDSVLRIKRESGLKAEIGGGIRNMETVEKYLSAGLDRVILGTAAVEDEAFLREALGRYGERIAVGVDIAEGKVAVRGWREKSAVDAFDFCEKLEKLGLATLISTDISRDGAMKGSNRALYQALSSLFSMKIVASGGVSSLEDVRALASLGLYGAIVGKALYTGDVDLKEAIEVTK
ncbi:MAG: 1-(5-phosphoribosyl)-5-[Clostridia bacterium]|nr:1-(5-phosphoribosyl)-5-[(5-phosphoribosylamino)methylideneamino]imidazole-4-carboxamide isomerase [Clostridia bacterium]